MKKLLAILLFFAGLSLSTQAQIQINSDFNVAAQRSVDGKQYKVVNNKHVPYADTTDFLATVPKTRRHIGQIAYIYGSEGRINVWQFIGGINQPNLHLVAPVAMSVNNSYPVQTIAEMLALDSLNVGDMVTVADSSKSYVLRYEPPTNFSNWLEVLSPLLASTDYLLEGTTNLYYTDLRSRNAITGGAGITYDKPSGIIANAYNAIPGANMSITGAMPNITFAVTGVYTKQEVENLIRDSINNLSITNGTILNDSTFLLCNQSGCDTFVVQNISISSFTFTSDSTVLVCNTAGSCDTITFNPVALSKFYVDSVKLIPGAVDTVRYYINGVGYNGGYVNHLVPLSDGVITPGYVTWLHDSTFFVTSATYIKNATFYTSPADTITVSGIDATYPVKFVFVVDTTGHANYIVGIPATVPLDPQPDPASQLPLTAGITFNAGATTPSSIVTTVIYNEHTEWGTSTTGTLSINFENTVNPFNGVKNIDVASYSKNAQILFEGATQTVSDQVLSAWAYLKVPLGNKNGFSFRFYNSATGASNSITVRSSFGLNPDLTNTWQQITVPISAFQWSSQTFNKWVITMPNGASNGFKLDKIELQSGLQNIPPQTDYSRKQDSTSVSGAQVYWWENGIRHLAGTPTDTAFINHLIKDSLITVKNNYYTIFQIDSINNNHYTTSQVDSIVNIINNNNYTSSQIDSITNIINSNHYTIAQVDSIVTVLRGEIVDAGGGGVLSVAKGWGILQDGTITSTGTVTVDSSIIKEALKATFVTNTDTTIQKKTDSLNVSLLNGDKIDTSHIPITPIVIHHVGEGLQTLYGNGTDTLFNKRIKAGTNVTLTQNADSSISINASGGSGTGKVYAGGHLANTNDSTINADSLATNLRNEIALKQDKITLTTTGTSGAATLSGSTLNIPQYSGGGGGSTDTTHLSARIDGKQDSLNVYMPEKYGAVGDGVTDDAAAFRAMIAAMPARGGKVHLMSKTYLIGSTVTVNKSIWFDGSGWGDTGYKTTLLSGANNIVLFRVVENKVTFSDLRIESLQSTPTAGSAVRLDSNLRTSSQIAGFNFHHVYFTGFYNQIEATGAFGGAIADCWFISPSNYGVWIANTIIPDAGDSYITGCTFMPKDNNSVAAIYQTSSGGLRISNNKFNQRIGFKFKYSYLGVVASTVDLLMNGNSFENYQISAVRLTGIASFFENIAISGNQFASYTSSARPDINIDSCSNISIQGNAFVKQSNDTAILLTTVASSNINNSYKNYNTPVIYSGTNSDLRGDGSGLINQYMMVNGKGLSVPTTLAFKDTSGIARITTKSSSGSVPIGYINDALTGNSQLTLASNINSGFGDIDFINSNIGLSGGFGFYQQTSPSALSNLFNIKYNKNVGFGGITNPVAYADIPAGTGTANTGQIHLAPGKATNGDGYLSYDTAIGGKHLYFNIGGTQYRLDSQSVSGGTGYLLQDGSLPLTGNWNVNNHNITGIASLSATSVSGSSISSNTTISANGAVSGTSFTSTQFNGGSGTLTGLLLRDWSQATSSVTAQNSLMLVWQGYVWNGTASQEVDYRAGVFPIGGTSTSEWKLSTSLAAGAYSDVLKVKSDGRVTLSNVINLKAYTVATLPTGTAGDVAYVTDASSPTYLGTLTGGGSTICPVFYNGVAWVSH